jgi:hypothetical protein
MKLKYLPTIIINGLLILSIFIFNTDTKTIITLFFLEMGIFSIFRFVRRLGQNAQTKFEGRFHSTGKTILELIIILGSIIAILFLVDKLDSDAPNMFVVIEQNIIIVASMIILEIIGLILYFNKKERADNSFYYSYMKLLVLILILMVFNWIQSLISAMYEGTMVLAVVCVLTKMFVDYKIAQNEKTETF